MSETNFVSVVVIDQQQESKGIIANAAFVIGLTAGRELPSTCFGSDVRDRDGGEHRYLTNIGHFVRKAGQSKLRTIREKLLSYPEVKLVGYTEAAAPTNYDAYSASLAEKGAAEIEYRALHIYGPESIVAPLTKNLSRLD